MAKKSYLILKTSEPRRYFLVHINHVVTLKASGFNIPGLVEDCQRLDLMREVRSAGYKKPRCMPKVKVKIANQEEQLVKDYFQELDGEEKFRAIMKLGS